MISSFYKCRCINWKYECRAPVDFIKNAYNLQDEDADIAVLYTHTHKDMYMCICKKKYVCISLVLSLSSSPTRALIIAL